MQEKLGKKGSIREERHCTGIPPLQKETETVEEPCGLGKRKGSECVCVRWTGRGGEQ